MKRTERGPKQAKAVVAVCVATAILLGGGSTYARWAQDVDATATIDAEIHTGGWEGVEIDVESVRWFDAHPAADGEGQGYVGASKDAAVGLWQIDLEERAIVPGDRILGVITLGDDVSPGDLDGEHLQVAVQGVDATGATVALAAGGSSVQSVDMGGGEMLSAQVVTLDGLGKDQVAVEVQFGEPYANLESEAVETAKVHAESMDSGATLSSISGLKVTVVQTAERASSS
jgi:hypothetical protein